MKEHLVTHLRNMTWDDMGDEAADAIEAQAKEIARLTLENGLLQSKLEVEKRDIQPNPRIIEAQAKRIAEQERLLNVYREQTDIKGRLLHHIDMQEATLRSIAANTCCDRCQEAALVAQVALQTPKSRPPNPKE